MSEQEREQQLHDWFAQRGFDLYFDRLDDGWMALALPQDAWIGAAAGEHGPTKVEAAERLKASIEAAENTVRIGKVEATTKVHGIQLDARVAPEATLGIDVKRVGASAETPYEILEAVSAPVEIPDVLRTRLEQRHAEFGWVFAFAREPNDSIMWAVLDKDGNALQSGIAASWDDARLSAIENLYPPSAEGSS